MGIKLRLSRHIRIARSRKRLLEAWMLGSLRAASAEHEDLSQVTPERQQVGRCGQRLPSSRSDA